MSDLSQRWVLGYASLFETHIPRSKRTTTLALSLDVQITNATLCCQRAMLCHFASLRGTTTSRRGVGPVPPQARSPHAARSPPPRAARSPAQRRPRRATRSTAPSHTPPPRVSLLICFSTPQVRPPSQVPISQDCKKKRVECSGVGLSQCDRFSKDVEDGRNRSTLELDGMTEMLSQRQQTEILQLFSIPFRHCPRQPLPCQCYAGSTNVTLVG